MILIFLLALSSFSTSAAYFKQLNSYVDQECPTWSAGRFDQIESWLTVGVNNSKSKGFKYEFPISRDGVDAIWCAIEQDRGEGNSSCRGLISFYIDRPFRKYENKAAINDPAYLIKFTSLEDQYNHYLDYVRAVVAREKMRRVNVGAILEILSRYYLQVLTNEYPIDQYTITSGVAYTWEQGKNTVGELDIIIFERASCDVVAIGESKASSRGNMKRSLKKAKKQLARFRDFLKKI
jgi:hypothetical protein